MVTCYPVEFCLASTQTEGTAGVCGNHWGGGSHEMQRVDGYGFGYQGSELGNSHPYYSEVAVVGIPRGQDLLANLMLPAYIRGVE
jgi:hypothetical protein